ncbi:cytochrome P450 [Streptomyces sp. Caat 7-52]|uniref:cytochrome P450 n=1 Tax=Streptomyces sp. Caat 7-52 TaxID=2949637 RepID=UPI0020357545|nr:cytochrome P450 [Streptomyces sp. Caat 7-52]
MDPRLSNDTSHRPPGYARTGQPAAETICKVLGVPREDERCPVRADALASSLDPHFGDDRGTEQAQQARQDMAAYLTELIETKRRHPGPGMLSALAPDMTPADLEATVVLLLVGIPASPPVADTPR